MTKNGKVNGVCCTENSDKMVKLAVDKAACNKYEESIKACGYVVAVFAILLFLCTEPCNNARAAVDNINFYFSTSSVASGDTLSFHEHCGMLVKLSSNRRTAERQRPLDEFNNGIVMTARPLHNDERFEVSFSLLVVVE